MVTTYKLSAPERALLLRIAKAGGVLGMSPAFTTRSAEIAIKSLRRRGLVDRGEDHRGESEYALSAAGLGLAINLAHAIVIETKPGRAPVVSRFVCSCGVVGDWTTTAAAHDAGDDHKGMASL
jgi:hypothetical protein